MAEVKSTENQAGRTARVDALKDVTRERDEARQVISQIAEALGLEPAATDAEVIAGARDRFESLTKLGAAAGAAYGEPWESVAYRIGTAQHYVRVLHGGA